MNQILVSAGYMGSGSSAFTNLVSEFKGYEINNAEFEYIFLHCPNGLFDLEDKLLRGNNALRSDEAIHAFLNCMYRLYHNPNYWFSGYKRKISPRFYELCEELVNDLQLVCVRDTHWYYQENIEDLAKRIRWNINFRVSRMIKRPFPAVEHVRPLDYRDVRLAYPDAEAFYGAAKKFLNAVYQELGISSHPLVLDQLLLPHNLFRIDRYFDDNLRVFVSARDPRDVFLLNKYVWRPGNEGVPFPTDAEDFCAYYDAMRRSETPVEDARVLRMHFEDLIFRYEASCQRIYDFLGISADKHKAGKLTIFNPEISINNTRLFMRGVYPAEEIRIIEKRLPQYLYNFPSDIPVSDSERKIF